MTETSSRPIQQGVPSDCGLKFNSLRYLRNQELGRPFIGWKDSLYSSLYPQFEKVYQTSSLPPKYSKEWGSVFGFGFNSDGSLLAAACENKCFMLYDPNNKQLVSRHYDAHHDCVNCVKFLDSRLFATCSDDNSVRLWDLRFLKRQVQTLNNGHRSWVKNVEYIPSKAKLITSGFDGNVFSWDINNLNSSPEKLLCINGIMRTVLTPSADKMIISTQGGYFIIIHNFDIDNLKRDMEGFKPHLYRIMQILNVPVKDAMDFTHMFSRERNKVEYMGDFPESQSAESTSIEVHPHGWCIASRSITADISEWTCVHDIQEFSDKNQRSNNTQESSCLDDGKSYEFTTTQRHLSLTDLLDSANSNPPSSSGVHSPTTALTSTPLPPETQRLVWQLIDSSFDVPDPTMSDDSHSDISLDGSETGHSSAGLSNNENYLSDFDEDTNSLESERSASRSLSRSSFLISGDDFLSVENGSVDNDLQNLRFSGETNSSISGTDRLLIKSMHPRLIFHLEEPNVGSGFIKEQSFSPEGRVLASPFGNCVRLLGFNSSCLELCDCVPETARPLEEICTIGSMNSIVLASCFSPTHPIVVAGCKDGTISFCTPQF